MSDVSPPIKIYAHFDGPITIQTGGHRSEVKAPSDKDLEPIELSPGDLDLPELLMAKEPGALVALPHSSDRIDRPLVFASHGKRVDLDTEPELLRAAEAAGRPVEIHVYVKPDDARSAHHE
ncbi:MAG TPA: hypothetical protein VG944_12280 [Fimbriimonas sp.]|nr:hypothetical protein [Fimbriimonas sp.]